MPRAKVVNDTFLGGLNTKANPTGLPPGYFTEVQNSRFNAGSPERRKGHLLLNTIEPNASGTETDGALDFNPSGATEDTYVLIPRNDEVHTLPPNFTIDISFKIEALPSLRTIIDFVDSGNPPFKITVTSTGYVAFDFIDEDSTTWNLTSPTAYGIGDTIFLRIRRTGSLLEMIIDGKTVASDNTLVAANNSITPDADLIIGAGSDDAGTFTGFEGVIDEFILWHISVPGHEFARTEYPFPRHPGIVGCYRFDFNDVVIDDSRYGNHGLIYGSATYTDPLVTRINPIVGIHNYASVRGVKKILVAGGELYFGKVI